MIRFDGRQYVNFILDNSANHAKKNSDKNMNFPSFSNEIAYQMIEKFYGEIKEQFELQFKFLQFKSFNKYQDRIASLLANALFLFGLLVFQCSHC